MQQRLRPPLIDLPSQTADVDIDHVAVAHESVAPQAVQDRLAWEDLAGVGQQQIEQIELARRQIDRTTAPHDLAGATVERHIARA